jgi:hypothetical protein
MVVLKSLLRWNTKRPRYPVCTLVMKPSVVLNHGLLFSYLRMLH